MTLGKRGRPRGIPVLRTEATTAGVTFDVGVPEVAAPPNPLAAMVGGEFSSGYNSLLPPRCLGNNFSGGGEHFETADFLKICGRCHRRLAPGHDIYMYRGDSAFCSLECREQQMKQDERKERVVGMARKGESRLPEMAASGTGASTRASTTTDVASF
ncbi:Protein of unknown function (DUF581 [Striga hermonthica]|uniref:FLZ-type domain-containing protein n=1 Tax=Striga hermonthica TaxID=68872 RepID=A0A9N7NMI4_STRHE|nr:Protein of unknown function (DUF581 [Striga hermonthica]